MEEIKVIKIIKEKNKFFLGLEEGKSPVKASVGGLEKNFLFAGTRQIINEKFCFPINVVYLIDKQGSHHQIYGICDASLKEDQLISKGDFKKLNVEDENVPARFRDMTKSYDRIIN